MVQVSKQTVRQWALKEYQSEIQRFSANVKLFEKKYGMTFEAFEKYIETAEKEVFEEWDDYLEWKADHAFVRIMNQKIEDIEAGNIEYVD